MRKGPPQPARHRTKPCPWCRRARQGAARGDGSRGGGGGGGRCLRRVRGGAEHSVVCGPGLGPVGPLGGPIVYHAIPGNKSRPYLSSRTRTKNDLLPLPLPVFGVHPDAFFLACTRKQKYFWRQKKAGFNVHAMQWSWAPTTAF